MVRNMIRLFEADAREFESNGLGSLFEATECTVTEEANGAFELSMVYPVWGKRFNDLQLRRLIVTKPNPVDPPQAFRIYSISKEMNGLVTYSAQHISYDLSGYPLMPFHASGVQEALSGLEKHSFKQHGFKFRTDKSTSAEFGFDVPISIRSALGGTEGSILDTYRGDYKFDNFDVWLYNNRGNSRDVTIRYGKNMTEFNQEENIGNIYTEILPYWTGTDEDQNEVYVELPEVTVKVDGEFAFTNILIHDFTSEFQNEPSYEQLRAIAKAYITDSKLGVPDVSFEVSFIQLEQSDEYKKYTLLERVELFDTVNIEFPMLNVSAKGQVTSTEFDAITGRYNSVTIGTVKASITDTMIAQDSNLADTEERFMTHMDKAVKDATNWITNGKGYMVAVKDEAGNWYEIASLDKPSLEDATNVWRWNNAGFGHSSSGYNGPYTTAITQDGHIVANFIDTGELNANVIKAGILQSLVNNCFYLDLVNGILRMNATEFTIASKPITDYIDGGIDEFVDAVFNPAIAGLQKQIDGQIESWYYDYAPVANKLPTSNWTTDLDKQKHEGDLFFNRTTGYAYRYYKEGSSWVWKQVQDTDITKALADASKAQDTADNKRRTFLTTPTPPYDKGDLWFGGTNTDVMVCVTSKANGSFSSSDWQKRDKYIDSSTAGNIATGKVNDAMNRERVFNALTDGGKIKGIFMRGDQMYVNGTYIYGGTLVAGGNSNENGVIQVKSGNGTVLVTLDNKGITLAPGTMISWNNISGVPSIADPGDIPTSEEILKLVTDNKTTIITKDYIGSLHVVAGSLEAGVALIGHSITVGGSNNKNGVIKVQNASGADIITLDNTGITLAAGTMISWSNISDKPAIAAPGDIPTDSEIVSLINNKKSTIITKDYVESLNIIAANIKAGNALVGHNITVGGLNNANGSIYVKDSNGTTIITLDKNGITLATNTMISWNNISNKPTIKSDSDIVTLITNKRSTIITEDYVSSLNVIAGSLKAGTALIGHSITVGGSNNNNGVIKVLDSRGREMGVWDNTGIDIDYDGKIICSGSNGSLSGSYETLTITRGTLKFSGGLYTTSTVSFNHLYGEVEYDTNGNTTPVNTGYFVLNGGGDPLFIYTGNWNAITIVPPSLTRNGQSYIKCDGYWDFRSTADMNKVYAVSIEAGSIKTYGDVIVPASNYVKVMDISADNSRKLYTYESSSPMHGDIGEATTDENGECYIYLDDIFSETISTQMEYQVFLQKEGPGDVWVAEKTQQYFVVKGTENLKFAWEIKAKQKDYEYERLEIYDDTKEVEPINYEKQYLDEINNLIKEQEEIYDETTE